ncbi:hypothetical protein UPYG_G00303220 [Umbra pygmaea]|uniref:Uncharacterized protein n=1 Tax=Umbra pygmaea TaxID=75934 RepID=A0ABD0WTJ2_UMBPY
MRGPGINRGIIKAYLKPLSELPEIIIVRVVQRLAVGLSKRRQGWSNSDNNEESRFNERLAIRPFMSRQPTDHN